MRIVAGTAIAAGLLFLAVVGGFDLGDVVEASRGDRGGRDRSGHAALAPSSGVGGLAADEDLAVAGVDGGSAGVPLDAELVEPDPQDGGKPQAAGTTDEGAGLHEGLDSLLEELARDSEEAAERWIHGGIRLGGSVPPPSHLDPSGLGGADGAEDLASDAPPEDGEWNSTSEGIPRESGRYVDGQRDGTWRTYHPNGQIDLEGEYNAGELEGLWVRYYSNGDIREQGVFRNGLREGVWRFYDRFGVPEARSGIYAFGAKID